MNPTPKRIAPYPATKSMEIEWTNGYVFRVPYAALRNECPCAGCVDEHTGEKIVKLENIPSDIRPIQVSQTGLYALSIEWSDRHNTGIYHFDRLYHLGHKYSEMKSQQ